ncbi:MULTISPECIES: DEAD/DEAH box helicase family protein [unclassified Corynebacterium]|uniref:DEAD/DEAH box helicase family protein n=1 Tax=unclassified Corynebacterium TaxID=2624378 RepID=UPI0029CA1D0E|nr:MULTISPECIES: DEAD/DEAH box helicase family protein [unclassified Corynebacterium]WPF66699.1 DEAD/DEAH box helicase family protein [Corynebacterium sp. 22KM0430]WPF69186.1 DEAD/DEAH box helicase family protein [Corynebacterium sp. 21KM1197]
MSTPTNQSNFLFEELDVLHSRGFRRELPAHIEQNLAPHIELREYQEHAFSNTLEYLSNESFSKNRQTHLLYHMATGSGKTVMMAGLILHYYSLGYRNFLFFVNQMNIIEKTKANFLDSASAKYLFAESVEIDGMRVPINEVSNFAAADPNGINLCFSTTQKLHMDFLDPKENVLTSDDFEDAPVVMISDESHHVNTRTKKATKAEDEEDRSWEYTVSSAFQGNRDNVLLEFTATVDLRDRNILQKYRDKIVFDYPLAGFRESGFTKDFQNFQSVLDPWGRTLQALIVSEYRRALFADGGVYSKPVVLLKSQRIDDSKAFYDEFFQRLQRLTENEILDMATAGLMKQAIGYFQEKDSSLRSLRSSIQQGFAEENAIIMNGSTDNSTEKQLAVNSLEDHSNPYRIIFTVDMLNEGWDVLNLYDIVRLYETRQGGKAGKPGAYTIKEAQLIGRGARYFPFLLDNESVDRDPADKFVRKYDHDLDSPNRLLETLLYHSKEDSKYITELRLALRETGLLPDEVTEVTYELKSSFKQTDFYHNAMVFSNSRKEVSREEVTQLDNRVKSAIYQLDVRHAPSRLVSLFDTDSGQTEASKSPKVHTIRRKINKMSLNVALGSLARYDALRFEALKHYFPHLESTREFITSSDYLGETEITFQSDTEDLTASDLRTGLDKVFRAVATYLAGIKVTYRGTDQFEAKRLNEVLRNKRLQIANPVEGGLGTSQNNDPDSNRRINLEDAGWYVYNDNYGTSEEKSFVKYFSTVVDDLKQRYDEVYLVRNERLAPLVIYSFATGERFEPDYLIFLRKKGQAYKQQQIYVEPKGTHLLQTDKWKEDFLLAIEQNAIPHTIYVDNTDYRIIGLPFYNQENRMSEFREALKAATLI